MENYCISASKYTFCCQSNKVFEIFRCLFWKLPAKSKVACKQCLLCWFILMRSVNIAHKRIAPGASYQNSAESSIKLFRHSLEKIINNSCQNGLTLVFINLNKLCLIAANLVNEAAPYNSFFSRKELFFGYYFYQKNHNMNRNISESSLLENTENLILYKNIQKFYKHRLKILNKQNQKVN